MAPGSSGAAPTCAPWVLALSLLGGCGTTGGPGRDIQDLDESGAAHCEFVEDISETEYTRLRVSGAGLDGVRAKVRNRAAEVGATHVVWENLAASGSLQAASARAYRCPVPGDTE